MKIHLPLQVARLSMLTLLYLCYSGGVQAAPSDGWGDWALDNERFIVEHGDDNEVIDGSNDLLPLDAEEKALFQGLDNSQLTDYPTGVIDALEDDRESFLEQLEELERAHAADLDDLQESGYDTYMPVGESAPYEADTEDGEVTDELPDSEMMDELPMDSLEDLPVDEFETEILDELENDVLDQALEDADFVEEGLDVIDDIDDLETENEDWESLEEDYLESLEDLTIDEELETDIADEMDL